MHNGFISDRARIAKNSLVSSSIRIYGNVEIGSNVILEPNVIIGHPSPSEQANLKEYVASLSSIVEDSFECLFDEFVTAKTVIEEGVTIRSGTVVYSGTFIKRNADIAHNCMIRENCSIGRDTHIITGAQIMSSVVIGHGCRIAGTLCNRTHVGNCTSMLGHAMHRYKDGLSGYIEPSPKIGNGVIVGREAAIVGGVEIGDFAVVGAGSVVTKSVPSHSVWIGNPAKQVKTRDTEECRELKRKVTSYENQH